MLCSNQPDPVSIASPVGESYECYSPKDEHVKTEATAADAIDQKHPAELIKTLKEQCIFRVRLRQHSRATNAFAPCCPAAPLPTLRNRTGMLPHRPTDQHTNSS